MEHYRIGAGFTDAILLKTLSSSRKVTLSMVLLLQDELLKVISAANSDSAEMVTCKTVISNDLDDRYLMPGVQKLLLKATFLDPQFTYLISDVTGDEDDNNKSDQLELVADEEEREAVIESMKIAEIDVMQASARNGHGDHRASASTVHGGTQGVITEASGAAASPSVLGKGTKYAYIK